MDPQTAATRSEQLRHQFDARAPSYQLVYDAPAPSNLWHHEKRRRADWTVEFCSQPENIPSESAILDVGCGDGRLACRLAALPHVERVVGIDVSPKMIDLARQRAACEAPPLPIEYHVRDAANLSGVWSVITCLGVIGYHTDPLKLCRHLASRLAPGGCLIVTTGNPLSVFRWIREFGGRIKRCSGHAADVPFRPTSVGRLAQWLEPCGCRLEVHHSLSFGLGIARSHAAVRRSHAWENRYRQRGRASRWLAQTDWLVWRRTL